MSTRDDDQGVSGGGDLKASSASTSGQGEVWRRVRSPQTIREQFDDLNLASMQKFVDDRRAEETHLEFKTVSAPTLKSVDDRRNLAKAISGFANSDGGLIIWGVDARKNADGVDCAVGLSPIENVALFGSRLNELSSEVTSPIVDGLRHNYWMDTDGSGFAATYVPASDSGPHMAKLGEGRYYKRSGDAFYKLEHFDLEDMFGRRPHPVLELAYKVVPHRAHQSQMETWDGRIVLGIENKGRGAAPGPMLSISIESPWYIWNFGIDGNRNFGLPRKTRSKGSTFETYQGTANEILHASTTSDVCVISARVEANGASPPDLKMSYRIAAANTRLIESELILPSGELERLRIQGSEH